MTPRYQCSCVFFFFNDTATTEIYTLSLHDALPICRSAAPRPRVGDACLEIWRRSCGAATVAPKESRRQTSREAAAGGALVDRKSTRLNSSHANISYAVFCLKKKKKTTTNYT